MWIQNFFKSLTSTPPRRRPTRRSPPDSRLCLEALEDRCLLTFSLPVDYGVGLNPKDVVTADFNGDGRFDLAAANSGSNTVSVLLGNGDGTFHDVTVTEGNIDTTAATFTVSLSAAYGQTVSIHYATADGGATVAGGDYQDKSGTLTFAPGQTTKTINVVVKGDKKKEANEWFNVVLSGASSNALIDNAYGWGTILNDDPGNGKGH